MLFAMSIGLSDEEDGRYTIYIPFAVSPGRKIDNINLAQGLKIDGLKIGFEKTQNYYALTIGNFETEEQAHLYYPKIKTALLWVSLKYLFGISTPSKLTTVAIFDSPTPIPDNGPIKGILETVNWSATDGHYDADKSVVRPENKRLIRREMGQGTVIVGLGANNFFECLREALSFPHAENVQLDSKLQLAIELYSSYFFEQSHEAKFIRLITVLEALVPDVPVEEPAKSIVKEIKNIIKERRSEYQKNSGEWEELEQLLSRAGKLKYHSIGRSLRLYISSILIENPEFGREEEVLPKLEGLYDIRSKLLHEGIGDKTDISNGLEFLNQFIPKLLEILYKQETA